MGHSVLFVRAFEPLALGGVVLVHRLYSVVQSTLRDKVREAHAFMGVISVSSVMSCILSPSPW